MITTLMLSLKKKLKNYALILPLVSFALLQQTLFAQVVSDTPLLKKNFIYTISDSETATLLGYKGSSRTLALPATLDGYQVTSIAERAFINQSTLRSVIIPSGITNIGNAAFAACANLKNIEVDPENPSYTSVDGVLFTGAQCFFISATSSNVAPPVENPVEVFIYSAPEAVTISHILIFYHF